MKIGRAQLEPYKTIEFQTTGVKEIVKAGAQFEIVSGDGAKTKSRKVLLAFGVKDEFPPIENFADFWGETVFHCPFCHGFEVRDEPLAVVGSGETLVEMAALLKSWSVDLVALTNGAGAVSETDRKLLAKHKIPVREEKIVRFEGADGRLKNIVFETGEKLARRGVLIRLKQHLRTDLAKNLGCELTETGHIKVSAFGETSVAGVYAAGDVTSPMQSIAAAVAQGAVAAGAGINRALAADDFV